MNFIANTMETYRGDSESFPVWLEDEAGVQQDFVTGDTVRFTVRRTTEDTVKHIAKTVTTFTLGQAMINILPADTASLAPGRYVWDVEVTFANGDVKTVVDGVFKVKGDVTYD